MHVCGCACVCVGVRVYVCVRACACELMRCAYGVCMFLVHRPIVHNEVLFRMAVAPGLR